MTYLGPIFGLQAMPKNYRITLNPQKREDITFLPRWRDSRTMAIPRKDITISQHDDVSIFFDFLDNVNNPLDISGFQLIVWIIADSVNGQILITKSTDNNTILFPASIRASTLLSKAETGSLPATNLFPDKPRGRHLYHELKGINSGGFQQTMLQGKVFVEDTRISD